MTRKIGHRDIGLNAESDTKINLLRISIYHADGRYYGTINKVEKENKGTYCSETVEVFGKGNYRFTLLQQRYGRVRSEKLLAGLHGLDMEYIKQLWLAERYPLLGSLLKNWLVDQ